MNLLIIGGLLAVGILAIIGAVLLGLSEQRAAASANRNQEPLPALSTNKNPTVKLRPIEEAADRQPAATETTLATLEGEQVPSSLNGQFHELAGEIRSLHQQAQSLEQRLGELTETIDHIERSRGNHTSIEEEAHQSSEHTIS